MARRLSCKTGDDRITAAVLHRFGDRSAGVAGRAIAFEYHIRSHWLEALHPTGERRRRVEEGGAADPTNVRNAKSHGSGVCKREPAILERVHRLSDGENARTGQVLLLQVDQYE